MIVTKGKLITKYYEYALKGVEVDRGIILGGNGYCFDTITQQILFVETIDGYMEIRVVKEFDNKKEYIYEKG